MCSSIEFHSLTYNTIQHKGDTMPNPLKLKMFICKSLTCWIPSSKDRKLAREFLFWFSYSDYIRFKNADYHVVSLGNSCLTRALAVATGIKPRRFYGEKSCPFDLCISKYTMFMKNKLNKVILT